MFLWMATEIVRSMLYRIADLIREIKWAMFDEVHYINDEERWVVWEEVIMLPVYINFVFLNATTSNTVIFSDWIGRDKQKFVYVIKTDYHLYLWNIMYFLGIKYISFWREVTIIKKRDDMKPIKPYQNRPLLQTKIGKLLEQSCNSIIKFLEREGLKPAVILHFRNENVK